MSTAAWVRRPWLISGFSGRISKRITESSVFFGIVMYVAEWQPQLRRRRLTPETCLISHLTYFPPALRSEHLGRLISLVLSAHRQRSRSTFRTRAYSQAPRAPAGWDVSCSYGLLPENSAPSHSGGLDRHDWWPAARGDLRKGFSWQKSTRVTRPRALNSPIAMGKRSTPFGAPGRRLA